MNMIIFGKAIRVRRLELGWTQEELSEKADISPTFMGNIERGAQLPSLSTTVRIANALEIGVERLLGDSYVDQNIENAKALVFDTLDDLRVLLKHI